MRIKILSWIILAYNYKRYLKKFHRPTECGTTYPLLTLNCLIFFLMIQ